MRNNKKKIKPFKAIALISILWIFNVLGFAGFAWAKSYFVDFGPRPTSYSIDLRKDKSVNGRKITFVATQAQPERYWYFGHLWVQYETTPSNAAPGTYQFGYYSKNQTEAAKELLISYLNPLGFYFGQKPVEGIIKSDDPWPHHLELIVQVDEATYKKALETDAEWRAKTIYTNNPGWGKSAYGCQDYAFAIANSIGLKTPKNRFAQFPAESFVNFAHENGIQVKRKWDFNRIDN